MADPVCFRLLACETTGSGPQAEVLEFGWALFTPAVEAMPTRFGVTPVRPTDSFGWDGGAKREHESSGLAVEAWGPGAVSIREAVAGFSAASAAAPMGPVVWHDLTVARRHFGDEHRELVPRWRSIDGHSLNVAFDTWQPNNGYTPAPRTRVATRLIVLAQVVRAWETFFRLGGRTC